MEQSVALIAVENVAYHFDIFYSYSIPDNLRERAVVGSRVLVPFGKSKTAKRQYAKTVAIILIVKSSFTNWLNFTLSSLNFAASRIP